MPEMCNKQWKHSQHAQLHTAERHARRTLSLLLNAPESRIASFPLRCVLEPNINHVLEMRNSYEGNVSVETARRIQKRMRQQNTKNVEKRKNIPICLAERLRRVRADWVQSEQGATSMGCRLESLMEKAPLPGVCNLRAKMVARSVSYRRRRYHQHSPDESWLRQHFATALYPY